LPGFRKSRRFSGVLMRIAAFSCPLGLEEMATRLRGGRQGGPSRQIEMIDRQKVEAILCRRFPSAAWADIAAAANAIMGLGDEWREIDCSDVAGLTRDLKMGAEIRLFRRAHQESPH
jgi:hypothetical protein